jgi:uncharacterized protein YjiS (DUF1127 family)
VPQPKASKELEAAMASETTKRPNLFTDPSSSIGLSPWIASAAAALARCVRRFVVTIKHRRELAHLADRDEHMLADIGLTRSDLDAAYCVPLWRDPFSILERRAAERRSSRSPGPASSPRTVAQNPTQGVAPSIDWGNEAARSTTTKVP